MCSRVSCDQTVAHQGPAQPIKTSKTTRRISGRVARSGERLGPEKSHSNSLRSGSADAVLVLGLPVSGTSSDTPSARTAMAAAAAAEPVETRHSADFAAPESCIMYCQEEQKLSLNQWLHGPTWLGSRSKQKKIKN